MNTSLNTTSSSKTKVSPKLQNLIEAFKNSSDKKSRPSFDLQEALRLQEQKIRQQERTRFEAVRREEKTIFSREQQEVKLQIESLQAQIKQLAKDQIGLMKEAEKASFQAVVNPGVYHKNFFERLVHFLNLIRQSIADAKSWLDLANHRAKKRRNYWTQFKQSGTKFSLSQERYMATQAG
jgi:hypothetical protein